MHRHHSTPPHADPGSAAPEIQQGAGGVVNIDFRLAPGSPHLPCPSNQEAAAATRVVEGFEDVIGPNKGSAPLGGACGSSAWPRGDTQGQN